MISILFKVSCHNRLQILSMLHWFIHVVDNCSVKINLICNESLFQFFQQIDMVKVYGKTDRILILGIFSTLSKSDILLNQLAMLSLDNTL